jgi:hypothetical protein
MKSFPAFGILFRSPGQLEALKELLQKNSGLPGPRANLELAYSFAASVSAMHLEEWQWDFLVQMAHTSPSKAPANTPKEYLPVCSLMALGALHGVGLPRPRRRAALSALKDAASDPRWRVREGVAMGLQLIGEKNALELREIVSAWLPGASLLEQRAIVACLAHPPLLGDGEFALFCIATSGTIVASLSRVDEKTRKDDNFRVLRQALGYALSVFAHHCPTEGFALMRKIAAVQDSDIAWIVRENLKKKRLTEPFAEDVRQVSLVLEKAHGAKKETRSSPR